MRFQPDFDLESVKELLKKTAKEATLAEVLEWGPTSWAHLAAVASGLNPFSAPAITMLPETIKATLPKLDFKPAPEDRKNAFYALKRALIHVNKAIVETTRSTYSQLLSNSIPNLQQLIQSQFPGGLEEFLGQLENELMDYGKRKMYLQAGATMMDAEQSWISKHHTFAVGILGYVSSQPKKCLTGDEFINVANDVGILSNGQLTYVSNLENTDVVEQVDPITKILQEAEKKAAQSRKNLLSGFKPKKKN